MNSHQFDVHDNTIEWSQVAVPLNSSSHSEAVLHSPGPSQQESNMFIVDLRKHVDPDIGSTWPAGMSFKSYDY